jgi:hypothetical protein
MVLAVEKMLAHKQQRLTGGAFSENGIGKYRKIVGPRGRGDIGYRRIRV